MTSLEKDNARLTQTVQQLQEQLTSKSKQSSDSAADKEQIIRIQQQFKEEKAQIEAKFQKQIDGMQKEAADRNMMMQEISKQMGVGKQSEQEKQAEIDKLKGDVKKMEKDKTELEKQIVGLTMLVQKDADMITMIQAQE